MLHKALLKTVLLSTTILSLLAPSAQAAPATINVMGSGNTAYGVADILDFEESIFTLAYGSTAGSTNNFIYSPALEVPYLELGSITDQVYIHGFAFTYPIWVGHVVEDGVEYPYVSAGTPYPLENTDGGRAYAVTFNEAGLTVAGWVANPENDGAPVAVLWGIDIIDQEEDDFGIAYILGNPEYTSEAYDISFAGKVVGQETITERLPMLWEIDENEDVVATPLATLGEWSQGSAKAISFDGEVAVGEIDDGSEFLAVRWTTGDNTVHLLGSLGGTNGVARAVNADGSVIVGQSNSRAFRWTEETGMEDLNTVLSDAGLNMSGIELLDATSVSLSGAVIVANSSTDAYYVYFDGDDAAALTTLTSVQTSIDHLADQQVSQMAEEHTTANLLLGNNGAMTNDSYTYMGGMFGSAVGYFGGQYAVGDNSVRGGVAFGHQDYEAVDQSNSTTFALAGRHLFAAGEALRPYAEIGGWLTPDQDLTLTRNYANGAGTSTGRGTTEAYSWSGYGQLGLVWQAQEGTQLRGYGELGQQVLSYNAYAETPGASNPFAATVADGQLRYKVTRFGGSVSQAIPGGPVPLSVTGSAAVAHAFNVKSNLRVNVAGVGSTQAAANDATWGEYGLQLGANLTEQWTATAGVIATSGNSQVESKLHGTVGLSYKY